MILTKNTKANAMIGENYNVVAGGNLVLDAQLKNNVENNAIAGEDGYPEEEPEITDGELEFVIVDGDENGGFQDAYRRYHRRFVRRCLRGQ